MNRKVNILVVVLILAVLAAGVVWYANRLANQSQRAADLAQQAAEEQQKNIKVPRATTDTSNWKTYRNEKYGFEVRYPSTWVVEEVLTDSIGSIVDCEATPKKCRNFAVRFSSRDGNNASKKIIMFQTYPKQKDTGATKDESNGMSHWQYQTTGGLTYVKSNYYFPIYGSCFTQVGIPEVSLSKNVDFEFYTLYELDGYKSMDEVENICTHELPDPVFDGIVRSFKVL